MKKHTLVLGAIVIALLLVACGGSPAAAPVTIVVTATPAPVVVEAKAPLLPVPQTTRTGTEGAEAIVKRNGLSFLRDDSFGQHDCGEDHCIFYGQSDGNFIGLYASDGQLNGFGVYIFNDSYVDSIAAATVEILMLEIGVSDATMDCISSSGFGEVNCPDIFLNTIADSDGFMSIYVIK